MIIRPNLSYKWEENVNRYYWWTGTITLKDSYSCYVRCWRTAIQYHETCSNYYSTKGFFFRPRSDGCRRSWHHRSDANIFPSSPIIEVASSLLSRQWAFLVNGLKYTPVCQSRFSRLPIDTIIEQEYQKLIEYFGSKKASSKFGAHFFWPILPTILVHILLFTIKAICRLR